MKLAMAAKQYLEGDMHCEGRKLGKLTDIKVLLGPDREATAAELRSYGFEIDDE